MQRKTIHIIVTAVIVVCFIFAAKLFMPSRKTKNNIFDEIYYERQRKIEPVFATFKAEETVYDKLPQFKYEDPEREYRNLHEYESITSEYRDDELNPNQGIVIYYYKKPRYISFELCEKYDNGMYYMYFRYDLADSTLSFDKIHLYKIENGKVLYGEDGNAIDYSEAEIMDWFKSNGISEEDLKRKKHWFIYDKVLKDWVIYNDKTAYSIDNYGDYKVTDDDMIDNYQSENADSENHKSIPLNEEYFPDECFRNYLKEKFDMDKNNILSGDEIGLAERLYINCDQGCRNMASLAGIEYLTELKYLDCYGSSVKDIDLSKNELLEKLYCNDTAIEKLDLSHNVNLQKLKCSETKITGLNLSENKKLTELVFQNTEISAINLSSNKSIEYLDCSKSAMTRVELSDLPNLETFICAGSRINEIDVSNNKNLMYLDISDTDISDTDFSQNSKLRHLSCSNCAGIKDIDLTNNTELGYLDIKGTQIKQMDLSQFTEIYGIRCDRDTEITGVDSAYINDGMGAG